MYILAGTLENACGDPAIATLLYYIKKFFSIIQIIGPIVAMVGLTTHLIKLYSNPDNKKYHPLLKNWLIAFLILTFVPLIVNLTMNLLASVDGEGFDLAQCWVNAEANASTDKTNGNPSSQPSNSNKTKKSITNSIINNNGVLNNTNGNSTNNTP